MVHKLQNEIKKLSIELIKARDQQEDHIRHLRALERALEKMERQKGQQQAAQVLCPAWPLALQKQLLSSGLRGAGVCRSLPCELAVELLSEGSYAHSCRTTWWTCCRL